MGQHMTPPVFPPEAAELLKSLGENNNRDFFTANRAVYDRAIRGPLEELLSRAQDKYGPGKITRANRDVRFSPDKTSYRIDASMWAGPVGAVYLRLTATGIEAGGGLYDPTRDSPARERPSPTSRLPRPSWRASCGTSTLPDFRMPVIRSRPLPGDSSGTIRISNS